VREMKAIPSLLAFAVLSACHASPEARQRALQIQADAACRCERAGNKACWSAFDKALPARAEGFWAACAPVSPQTFCWGENGKEICVTKRRDVWLSRSHVRLCSAAEAVAAERLLAKHFLDGTAEAARAEDAVRALAHSETSTGEGKPSCG